MPAVLKTAEPRGSVSSNLTRSATYKGCVMGLRVILARSLSMGSIPIRSTKKGADSLVEVKL